MTLRSEIFKGSVALTAGQSVSFGCSFARNVILARLLTKADFGLAATFSIVVSLLELADKLSISSLIVQAKEGDDPAFEATAHFSQAMMGLASAACFFALAWPLSQLFNVPDALWAFQLLGLIPLFRGFAHLDVNRMVREMRFGPVVAVDAIPQVVITLAAWPMAMWLKDYRALLWLLLAKWAMTLVGSHALARRPYRWAWNAEYLKRVYTFGWPLFVNGFLMVGIFQGDRLAIGSRYTMADLGLYSVASSLSLTPGFMLVTVSGPIILPLLSRVQDTPEQFRRRYVISVQGLSLFATVFAATMIVTGEILVSTIFGQKYAGTGPVLGWLAAAQALRLIRVAPTIASMAKGDTMNLTVSNAYRLSGLGFALIAAALRLEMQWIAAAGLAGEILAFFVSMLRLQRFCQLSQGDAFHPVALAGALTALAGGLAVCGAQNGGWLIVLPTALALASVSLGGSLILFCDFRRELALAVGQLRSRLGPSAAR